MHPLDRAIARKKRVWQARRAAHECRVHDAAELQRFRDYLEDRGRLSEAELAMKWGDYLQGKS